jgi:parallel beta-helix repeat protein
MLIKSCLAVLFVSFLLFGFVMADVADFDFVQAATTVSGIITNDTTWTKNGGPYTLTGNTLIEEGVTLTIEAGATVDLNDYYIMVTGILTAKGASDDNIYFRDGSIHFSSNVAWDEESGTGCLLDNCDCSLTNVYGSTGKITNCYIDGAVSLYGSVLSWSTVTHGVVCYGSSIITNNIILGKETTAGQAIYSSNGTPVIANNTVSNGIFRVGSENPAASATISFNTVSGGISVADASVISNNTLSGAVSLNNKATLAANTIVGGVHVIGDNVVSDNTITGATVGVELPDANVYARTIATITGNTISNCSIGIYVGEDFTIRGSEVWGSNTATITGNLIYNCTYGIHVKSTATVEKNTVIHNTYGVRYSGPLKYNLIAYNTYGLLGYCTPIYNSIYGNSKYNLDLGSPEMDFSSGHINATYNWWGTADSSAISQTFYDYYSDYLLGKVTYIPFLTASDPQTPTSTIIPSFTPIPTLSPTSPTASPTQTSTPQGTTTPSVTSEIPNFFGLPVSWVIAVVVVVAVIAVLAVVFLRRKPKTYTTQP